MDNLILKDYFVQYDDGLAAQSCVYFGRIPQGTVVLDNFAGVSNAENAVILTKLPKN